MIRDILCLASDAVAGVVQEVGADLNADVVRASTLDALFQSLGQRSWDACVVSLASDHVDESVLDRIANSPASGALVLTAPGASLDAAFLAERLGALALLREPSDPDELRATLESGTGEGPSVPLPDLGPDDDATPTLVGESPEMGRVFSVMAKVARSTTTVLITGESGTGKEVVARTLHDQSDRASSSFVAVNCAAIPEHLLESELFGHEKGAFTGAVARRQGRFQRAHGGTLFLDEVGDMSLVLQAKVLRVLEERRVERVGAQDSEAVDVRVVAATNQALGEAIADGRFREDLYYRLAVVEIELPPLRERGGDIRRLALHFAALFARRHGRPVQAISRDALARIESSTWTGNVRELRNVMDRAVLLTQGDTIRTGALRMGAAAPRASSMGSRVHSASYPTTASLAEVEADHIRRVLASVEGHIGNAADVLGIHRNTLSRKIQEYGLDRDGGAPS